MSCPDCAKEWNDKGKVQILQVPEIGNGIFRVAACDKHFEELKKIIAKGLKPAPKKRATKPKQMKKVEAKDE